jgi:DNA-binding XRE family transcriptional regulator
MKKQDLTPEDIKNHRRSLSLTQKEAARLLNVSKNTWIRWERGKCRYDELALKLLRRLALDECPTPCAKASKQQIDSDFLSKHVPSCKQCWLMVQFLSKQRLS